MESENLYNATYFNAGDNHNPQFTVDDLFDFSKGDSIISDTFFDDITPQTSTMSFYDASSSGNESHFTSNNCFSTDAQFSCNEFSVPYADLTELEWVSNYGHASMLSNDMQNLQLISGTYIATPSNTSSSQCDEFMSKTLVSTRNCSPVFGTVDKSIPSKARSKRSRAAPHNWSSRILGLPTANSSSCVDKKGGSTNLGTGTDKEDPVRKCTHCGSDKTPQWRSGPMGPKTLCNACGVRHKSGRLVPEYRPAASPTFVSDKHSNSHRKVLELRRQKELQLQMQQHEMFNQSSTGFTRSNGYDYDYYIRPRIHTDFTHI